MLYRIFHELETSMRRLQDGWDWLGAGLSAACGLHCIALSAFIMATPAIWLRGEWLGIPLSWFRYSEIALLMLTFAVTCVALTAGYRRHRRTLPSALGAVGILCVLAGVAAPSRHGSLAGSLLVMTGGLVLVVAHLSNARLPRSPDKAI